MIFYEATSVSYMILSMLNEMPLSLSIFLNCLKDDFSIEFLITYLSFALTSDFSSQFCQLSSDHIINIQ